MAAITDIELLTKVKNALGITGDYQNETLQIYIGDVKDYMRCAGVNEITLNSDKSVGAICRGVSDIWNYGAGTEFSTYFMQRVTQLAYETAVVEDEGI
jgi:hypothetical protein